MRARRLLPRLLAPLVAAALLVPPAAAARVPRGWLGVNLGPEFVAQHGSVEREVARIASAGGETVRLAVYWSALQPYATAADVPERDRSRFADVGGVPTDFTALDRLAATAAKRRVALLPVVLGAPRWAAAEDPAPIARPRDPAEFARFAGALAARYGSTGTFWAARPGLPRRPIRSWQVWNEVSNAWYWGPAWEVEYPPLLRATYDALKAADPRASVLMAGLNTGGGGGASPQTSWSVMERIYRQLDDRGLGRPFDVGAVHVYTRRVPDAVRVVEETRRVMARHGDRARPLRVSELAWPAARGRLRDEFFAATTDRGMAQRLEAGMRLLAARRRALGIAGVDWFQWASAYSGTDDPFRYSGLRRARGRRIVDRPALAAFRVVARSLRRP
jgi:hypothetical protein